MAEEGEILAGDNAPLPKPVKRWETYSGEGHYTLELFQGDAAIHFVREKIPEAEQGFAVLSACSPQVKSSVYHGLGIRHGVLPEGGVTLAAVWSALKEVKFETLTTDKQIIAAMGKKRADSYKGTTRHLKFLKWLEAQRALLQDQSTLSDDAFQALFERGCHPKFAVLVSTDGGKPYESQAAWRAGVVAQSQLFDQTEAVTAGSEAYGNISKGNGNTYKSNGHSNKNGKFKKGKTHFNGKPGVKGGVKKKDTSQYICKICNHKGHGPWDKNLDGSWVCPKKRSTKT